MHVNTTMHVFSKWADDMLSVVGNLWMQVKRCLFWFSKKEEFVQQLTSIG